MVMYSITTKLNSTFRTTGKATGKAADKMTAKVVGKFKPFALAWTGSVKNEFHAAIQQSRSAKFWAFLSL